MCNGSRREYCRDPGCDGPESGRPRRSDQDCVEEYLQWNGSPPARLRLRGSRPPRLAPANTVWPAPGSAGLACGHSPGSRTVQLAGGYSSPHTSQCPQPAWQNCRDSSRYRPDEPMACGFQSWCMLLLSGCVCDGRCAPRHKRSADTPAGRLGTCPISVSVLSSCEVNNLGVFSHSSHGNNG